MMDDLNSIAFSRSSCSNISVDEMISSSINSSSQGCPNWNSHIGVFNADMSQYMEMMSSSPAPFVDDADLSTGYLQDVLFDFSSKRRRLLMEMIPTDHHSRSENYCWTSDLIKNCCQEFDTLTQFTKPNDIISDMKTGETEVNSETYDDSSSSSQKELMSSPDNQWTPDNYKGNVYCIDPIFSSAGNEKRNKRMLAKVVYPFALVKPGGLEGDMTLNDINARILMPPTRPVRHPVGDFACRPLVSPHGPGLSGKTVVAFTRIHTQGRGTITIIRTRG